MEGLRTRLQWEVNRLEVENRRLREGDAEAGARVDLEGELERSKAELAQMAARVEESAAQAADQAQAAERRARETEELAGHQEQALEEIRTRLQETVEELRVERRESTAVRNTLAASEERSGALEEELARLEDELRTKSEEFGRQRAALELERYRWMEETTKKWEARESRLLDQLDKMGRTHAGGGDNAVLCEQLQEKLVLVTEEVHSYEGVVGELKAENEGLRLAREELKAELAFAWARVRRLEGRGAKEPDVGGKGGLQTGLLPTPGPDENGTYNPVSSESHAHCTQAPAFPQSNAALVHDSGPMFTTNSSMMPAAYQSMSRPSGARIPTCMLSDPTHASVVVVPSAPELSPVRAGVVATPGRQTPATAVLGRRVSTPPLQAASVSAAAALVPTQMSPMASIRPRPQWGRGAQLDAHSLLPRGTFATMPQALTWVGPTPGVPPSVMSAPTTSALPGLYTLAPHVLSTEMVERQEFTSGALSRARLAEQIPVTYTGEAPATMPGLLHASPVITPAGHDIRDAAESPGAVTTTPTSSDIKSTTAEKQTTTPGPYYPLSYPPTVANLLPQIPSFNGSEQRDGETVQDWIEHFESVATLAGWNDHFKLVHLASALRGTARAFYRSCTPAQKNNYNLLVAELKKRFTPVQLTAVQTQSPTGSQGVGR